MNFEDAATWAYLGAMLALRIESECGSSRLLARKTPDNNALMLAIETMRELTANGSSNAVLGAFRVLDELEFRKGGVRT